MSNLEPGRNTVVEFMKKNDISDQDLATAYGKSRTWVRETLSGVKTGPAANRFILVIIRDYKIRDEEGLA